MHDPLTALLVILALALGVTAWLWVIICGIPTEYDASGSRLRDAALEERVAELERWRRS